MTVERFLVAVLDFDCLAVFLRVAGFLRAAAGLPFRRVAFFAGLVRLAFFETFADFFLRRFAMYRFMPRKAG